MTTQGATFNMHGQLYHEHTNVTALFSSPVVSALGSESNNLRVEPPSRTSESNLRVEPPSRTSKSNLRVEQQTSWSRQGVVCLKLAGKKKCKLRF